MANDGNPRLSEVIATLAQRANGTMTLRAVLADFGERSFGAVMILFAALSLIPAASIIFAIPLLLISAQLALGRRAIWLPASLLDRPVPSATLKAMAARIVPHLRQAERVLKPRGTVLTAAWAERLAGIACLAMAIILFLPIPGANFVPAMALILFALGLIEQDGLAMAAGWIAAAATVLVLAFVADRAFVAVTRWIPDWLGL